MLDGAISALKREVTRIFQKPLELSLLVTLRGPHLDIELVASFSGRSNLSVSRAGSGFVIGEGRSVRHNVLDLLHLKRRGLSLRLQRTEGSEPQLRRAGRETV